MTSLVQITCALSTYKNASKLTYTQPLDHQLHLGLYTGPKSITFSGNVIKSCQTITVTTQPSHAALINIIHPHPGKVWILRGFQLDITFPSHGSCYGQCTEGLEEKLLCKSQTNLLKSAYTLPASPFSTVTGQIFPLNIFMGFFQTIHPKEGCSSLPQRPEERLVSKNELKSLSHIHWDLLVMYRRKDLVSGPGCSPDPLNIGGTLQPPPPQHGYLLVSGVLVLHYLNHQSC